MNSTTEMNETEDFSAQFLGSTRFWFQRVLVPIMVCIGVGGNTVTVVVLTRKRMRCSTNIYLTALAVADIVYLFFVFFLSFSVYENIKDRKYELYWKFVGLSHWLCDSASNTSIWLTVSFTLERYIAVCHPIRGKVLCTENRAKIIIAIVAIWCVVTSVSTAFEYELAINSTCTRNCTTEELAKMQYPTSSNCLQNASFHYVSTNPKHDQANEELVRQIYSRIKPAINNISINCNSSQRHVIYVPVYPSFYNDSKPQNSTELDEKAFKEKIRNEYGDEIFANETCCSKNFTVEMKGTSLGNNENYQAFIEWYFALCFVFLPLILIATFNCFLVRAVYESQRKRRKMTNAQGSVSLSNENRITVMLIGVVFLFLVCQTPTALFLIYKNFNKVHDDDDATERVYRALGNIFNFLVTVNASMNPLMYCVLSKKYRTTFMSLFCGRSRKKRQDTLALSSTRTRFTSYENGFRRNISEYHTPRNLETQSLTSIPRSKSLMMRAPGKAKSTDLNT